VGTPSQPSALTGTLGKMIDTKTMCLLGFLCTDRKDAWTIVLESLALGASIPRVKELSKKWKMDYEDSKTMLMMLKPDNRMREGLSIFIENVLEMKEEDYWNKIIKRVV